MNDRTCPVCDAPVRRHCDEVELTNGAVGSSRTCTWWRCTKCWTYGNDTRHVADDRRRGPA